MEPRAGEWQHSDFFAYVGAAHDWGRLPSELGLCRPEDDAVVMTAYTLAHNKMGAWEQTQAEKKKG